jgi:hypothetical protein
MLDKSALVAVALLFSITPVAHANAPAVYQNDPNYTRTILTEGGVGFFLGASLLACTCWWVWGKGVVHKIAATFLFLTLLLLLLPLIGNETRFMKGDRPPWDHGQGWAFRPDGAEPRESQEIYPMITGLMLSWGIAYGGLFFLRWRKRRSDGPPSEGFGTSRSSPDGIMD